MISIKSRFHLSNFLLLILLVFISHFLSGQKTPDTLPSKVTLSQCISYALDNQSLIKQSLIDEDITRRDIRISLSGWYPQLEFDAGVQHYLQIPLTTYPNLSDPAGTPFKWPAAPNFSSSGVFSANQIIYSSNLYFSSRTASELRNQAAQKTKETKISIYADVTKAFFDVLLTEEQLKVLDEDIVRLQRNYKDTYSLYQKGLTDKIDFQRASISLNLVQAQRKSAGESVKAKYALLKLSMGVAPEKSLTVSYDSIQYENEILMDTARVLDYSNRVEYRILQSYLNVQNLQINFYKYSALPTLSAFYNYIPQFGSSRFSNLYDKNNPSSMLGMKMTFPLFQGLRRVENLGKARLQYNRLQLGMDYLKNQINSEYSLALTQYVSNLNELRVAKKNIVIARDIYNTVKLQYENGIKAYLEVLVSETDLRSSELNYLNLLFRVLASKIDLEKALGTIQIN